MKRWGWPLLITGIVVIVVLFAYKPYRGRPKEPTDPTHAKHGSDRPDRGTNSPNPRVNGIDETPRPEDKQSPTNDAPAPAITEEIARLRDLKDDALSDHDKDCAEIVRRLSHVGRGGLDEILAAARDNGGSMAFRLALLDAVAAMTDDASLASLTAIFSDRNAPPLLRNRALAGLTQRKNDETFTILKSVFESDAAYQGRHLILLAMGEIGDRRAVATLSDVARDERDMTVRTHAITALGAYAADRNVGDLLIDIVRNELDTLIRRQAVLAIGKGLNGDRRAQLRALSESVKNDEVREAIEHVLQYP